MTKLLTDRLPVINFAEASEIATRDVCVAVLLASIRCLLC